MNKILYALLLVMPLTSCVDSYNIKGTSNDSNLEDSKIYLTVIRGDDVRNIDSCEVVHGQFSFCGNIDSVRVAQIGALPVVLEKGDITVRDDNTLQSATGTPLNDSLTAFMHSFQRIVNQSAELQRRPYQALMNGEDENAVRMEVEEQTEHLNAEMDRLLTRFVTENFDNVLGPWVFLNACAMKFHGTPLTDAWVDDIMSKATDKFKNDPMVRDYCHKAQENEKRLNGLSDTHDMAPATDLAPTPNELATTKDSTK